MIWIFGTLSNGDSKKPATLKYRRTASPPLGAERATLPLSCVQFLSDGFERPVEIMQYVVVPKADDAVAAAREFGCAGGVFLPLLRMLSAIDFDRELAARTSEIHDIRTDRMLSPEAVFPQLLPQSPPQPIFGIRGVAAQSSCDLRSRSQQHHLTPSLPSGAERAGVRWGNLVRLRHLTFPLLRNGPSLPPKAKRRCHPVLAKSSAAMQYWSGKSES
jgi:hypothetical protein